MTKIYENILVAIDGSTGSEQALNKAIQLTKRHDATLHLVHVIEQFPMPGDTGSIKKTQENLANKMLDKYVTVANNQAVKKVEKIIGFGHPRTHISKKTAKEMDADLIVCGATGLNAVERLIGSVSDNIVRTAHCDVLIVR